MKNIPALLLTGYLGSGKTTLVCNILSNRKGIKFAVIVNDIGEVNIDASLIERDGLVSRKDESLVALQNGCICCTLKMDLVSQLDDIIKMGKFDYIVIEASGICEPEPIARTICSIPLMDKGWTAPDMPRLDCIVTVVDALRMRDEFSCAKALFNAQIAEEDIENLVIQQIEFCNMVLLNKASEVSADDLGKIRGIVRSLQPKARILPCDYGKVELDALLDTNLFKYNDVAASAAWISAIEGPAGANDDDDEDEDVHDHPHEAHDHEKHGHHHHHHDEGEVEEYGIGTWVYYRRDPFNINEFDQFVARHWPSGVIRCKGICYFADEPDICYLFEQAGSQISLKNIGQWYATMPEEELKEALRTDASLARDWDPFYGDRMLKLVFIGQHLDKDGMARKLDACLAKEQ